MSEDTQRELVRLIGERFIARKDVKARQWVKKDGTHGWSPVRTGDETVPFKMSDFRDHLSGKTTFGHYLVTPESECKLFAFDIDLRKPDPKSGYKPEFNPREVWVGEENETRAMLRMHLRCVAEGLAIRIWRKSKGQIFPAISTSGGKGVHVYGFTGIKPAAQVRAFATAMLTTYGEFEPSKGENFFRHKYAYEHLEVEVFPKQGEMEGKEFGNLMSLPLGVNQITGNPKYFIDTSNGYNEPFLVADPIATLMGRLPWGEDGEPS